MAHFRPEKGGWYLSSQHINSKVKILLLDSRAGLWPAFGDHFCSNNPEFSVSEKLKKGAHSSGHVCILLDLHKVCYLAMLVSSVLSIILQLVSCKIFRGQGNICHPAVLCSIFNLRRRANPVEFLCFFTWPRIDFRETEETSIGQKQ